MNLMIRLPDGVKTVPAEEIIAKAKEIAAACPSEITCAYRHSQSSSQAVKMPNHPHGEVTPKS